MQQSRQMSETLRIGIILAMSGGFMDAYSYLYRDHVFANAQTGNMLLFGVRFSEGNFTGAFQYFCPVIAFTAGIMLSDIVRYKICGQKHLHWRQAAVLLEALILLVIAFVPTAYNLLANSLTSLACGIQVESFRKVRGNGIATTMCIGNLRSGTQNLCDYLFQRNGASLKKCLLYYGIICSFVLGAILGSVAIKYLQGKSILICSIILLLVFFMMFIENVHGRERTV